MVKKIACVVIILSIYGCGGGEDKSEDPPPIVVDKLYINGFEVPPEPDSKLNSATLLGVDSNRNNVRDDIERVIAKNAKSKNNYEAEIYTSSIMSGIMDERKDAFKVSDLINCSSYKYPDVDHREMFELLVNNDQRNVRYAEWRYSVVDIKEVVEGDKNWGGDSLCEK